MKKVTDPDPAGQKSTDPTGSGSSSLVCGMQISTAYSKIRFQRFKRLICICIRHHGRLQASDGRLVINLDVIFFRTSL